MSLLKEVSQQQLALTLILLKCVWAVLADNNDVSNDDDVIHVIANVVLKRETVGFVLCDNLCCFTDPTQI